MLWYEWLILAAYVGVAILAYRFLRQPIDMTPTTYRCDTPGCLAQHPVDWAIGPIIERMPRGEAGVWAVGWPLLILVLLFGLLGT